MTSMMTCRNNCPSKDYPHLFLLTKQSAVPPGFIPVTVNLTVLDTSVLFSLF